MLTSLLWKQVERRYVFYPTLEIESTPQDLGIVYEDVFFPTQSGCMLHGWFVPGGSNFTWLWFHGNGGNIGHRVTELALLHHRLGINLLIFDYQGYGKSQGTPSEQGTYVDARAALSYLRKRSGVVMEKVVYFGHSLGTAIAVELATAHAPMGMVLASPFASVADMARIAFPWAPTGWLVRDKYNSLARISNVRCPLLILHGENDGTVPLSQARKLFEAANLPKRFQALPETGHNYTFEEGGETYWRAIRDFQAGLGRVGEERR